MCCSLDIGFWSKMWNCRRTCSLELCWCVGLWWGLSSGGRGQSQWDRFGLGRRGRPRCSPALGHCARNSYRAGIAATWSTGRLTSCRSRNWTPKVVLSLAKCRCSCPRPMQKVGNQFWFKTGAGGLDLLSWWLLLASRSPSTRLVWETLIK